LLSNFVLSCGNLTLQETEWGSKLVNEDSHLLKDTRIVFDLGD